MAWAGVSRDRRQNSERVAGQEHDVLRVVSRSGRNGSRDLADVVARSRVLRVSRVVEIELARRGIHHHVLKERAEGSRRIPDDGLRVAIQSNHLRVAAALEVEDAVVRPSVLVVSDQRPGFIGREGRLTGPTQPEVCLLYISDAADE